MHKTVSCAQQDADSKYGTELIHAGEAVPPLKLKTLDGKKFQLDKLKGKYVVLINKELHDHTGTTEDWIKFFSFDKETPLIMEDIVCKTADTDAQGIEVAEKYRARLPENQMKLQKEAGVMLLSKAELGRFDVVILSEAAAQNYSAQTMYDRNNVAVIKM